MHFLYRIDIKPPTAFSLLKMFEQSVSRVLKDVKVFSLWILHIVFYDETKEGTIIWKLAIP